MGTAAVTYEIEPPAKTGAQYEIEPPASTNDGFSARDPRSFWDRLRHPHFENDPAGMPGSFEGHPENVGEYVPASFGEMAGGVGDIARGDIAKGGHRAISGAMEAVKPMAPMLAAGAPGLAARSVAGGYLGGKVAGFGAKLFGADPEQAEFAGDIGNVAGGYAGAELPRIAGAGGRLLTKTAGAVDPDWLGLASPRLAHAQNLMARAGRLAGKFAPSEAPALTSEPLQAGPINVEPGQGVTPIKSESPAAATTDVLKRMGVASPKASLKPMNFVPGAKLEPAPYSKFEGATHGESAAMDQLTHTGINPLRTIAINRGLKVAPADTSTALIRKIYDDLTPVEIQEFSDAAIERNRMRTPAGKPEYPAAEPSPRQAKAAEYAPAEAHSNRIQPRIPAPEEDLSRILNQSIDDVFVKKAQRLADEANRNLGPSSQIGKEEVLQKARELRQEAKRPRL